MAFPYPVGVVWLRRDLRVHDHPALSAALAQCAQVHCVFVLDRAILDPLPRRDRRVEFILHALAEVDTQLRTLGKRPGCGLIVLHGNATELIAHIIEQTSGNALFYAQDYEPAALQRDAAVAQRLKARGVDVFALTDHVLCPPGEVLTQSKTPYTVYTPFARAWWQAMERHPPRPTGLPEGVERLAERPAALQRPLPTLVSLGFEPTGVEALGLGAERAQAVRLLEDFGGRVAQYRDARDFPALKGPSYLSVHLRFGTLSVREAAARAWDLALAGDPGARCWLGELAWRDFYFHILAHFPHAAHGAFKPAYDAIEWENGPAADALFEAWSSGATGYPIVDAAMRQLLHSGYMHNRLRMIAGSFLVKHLGLDWRRGERFFAQHLNDYELASNNGGWQWVASSGCDAQPYFRIFNPVLQSQRFDPEGRFLLRYLPELRTLPVRHLHAPWLAPAQVMRQAGITLGKDYPAPCVDHARARAKTMLRYGVVKEKDRAAVTPAARS